MTTSDVEAHSRAVVSLQALLSKHCPGTSPFTVAERALDLAFNGLQPRGGDIEQKLLEDARLTIDRQVRARLIGELSAGTKAAQPQAERGQVRTRFLAWRGALRPRVAEHLVQAELWLTIEKHSGDGDARRC